jgi:site-specific recombinase XerD
VVLWRGGLRVSEALALQAKDFDPDAGTIRVLHGKGDEARTVALDPQAFALVERWLRLRTMLGLSRAGRVFCTLKGRPLDPSYLRQLLPRLARRAGIDKRVHPHGLRHTHAAELAREGVPVNVIQLQLGHRSIGTTTRYLQHVAPQELVERIRERPAWRDVT